MSGGSFVEEDDGVAEMNDLNRKELGGSLFAKTAEKISDIGFRKKGTSYLYRVADNEHSMSIVFERSRANVGATRVLFGVSNIIFNNIMSGGKCYKPWMTYVGIYLDPPNFYGELPHSWSDWFLAKSESEVETLSDYISSELRRFGIAWMETMLDDWELLSFLTKSDYYHPGTKPYAEALSNRDQTLPQQ